MYCGRGQTSLRVAELGSTYPAQPRPRPGFFRLARLRPRLTRLHSSQASESLASGSPKPEPRRGSQRRHSQATSFAGLHSGSPQAQARPGHSQLTPAPALSPRPGRVHSGSPCPGAASLASPGPRSVDRVTQAAGFTRVALPAGPLPGFTPGSGRTSESLASPGPRSCFTQARLAKLHSPRPGRESGQVHARNGLGSSGLHGRTEVSITTELASRTVSPVPDIFRTIVFFFSTIFTLFSTPPQP